MNFVQIGTNNGRDEFNRIISSLTSPVNVYLFEAIPNLIPAINVSYSSLKSIHNIHIIGKGVVVDKTINILNVGGSDEHSSIINRGSIHGSTINFESITFNEFIDEYNIKEIEFLCIDVEGYDYEILNSIDLDKVKIKEIVCEEWPYSDNLINTGPKFFKEVIIPKYSSKGFRIDSVIFDSMRSFKFSKI